MRGLAANYVLLNLLDYGLTYIGLRVGHGEGGPIGAYLPAKLLCLAVVLGLSWYVARRNRYLAELVLIGANGVYWAVIGWNVLVLAASPV